MFLLHIIKLPKSIAHITSDCCMFWRKKESRLLLACSVFYMYWYTYLGMCLSYIDQEINTWTPCVFSQQTMSLSWSVCNFYIFYITSSSGRHFSILSVYHTKRKIYSKSVLSDHLWDQVKWPLPKHSVLFGVLVCLISCWLVQVDKILISWFKAVIYTYQKCVIFVYRTLP